jgi:hypothetical protein
MAKFKVLMLKGGEYAGGRPKNKRRQRGGHFPLSRPGALA